MSDRRLPLRLNRILPSSGLLRGVSWFKTDVLRLTICPIFEGQTVQEEVGPLKMGRLGSPEKSVLNPLTPRNNPEDGRKLR